MKALLFGLLALQLVMTDGAYGMRLSPRSLHQQPLPPLRSIPSPSHECMKDLIDKFGATETISKTAGSPSKTTKVMEIDISYPSFLRFFIRKYIELSKKEVVDRMEKAKEDIIKRMELMEAGYFPKFYNNKPGSYNFHISKCIPFEADEFIRRALEFTGTIDFKVKKPGDSGAFGNVCFHKPETNLDNLMEWDILPMILDRWEGGEFNWMNASGDRNHSDFGDLFSMKPAVIPSEEGSYYNSKPSQSTVFRKDFYYSRKSAF